MRFYTKEWYGLLHTPYYGDLLTVIPDKEYSEEDIAKLYEGAFESDLKKEKEGYNTPPLFGPGFFPDYDFDWEQEQRRFESRPPFDSKTYIADWEASYTARLENVDFRFPEWIKERVDRRLLALDLIPESVYVRLEKEEKARLKAVRRMEREAKKSLWREWEQLPERLKACFGFGKNRRYEEACLLSLSFRGADMAMELRKGEWAYGEGDTPYDRILFRDAVLLEKDEGIWIECRRENGAYFSQCEYLMEELYCIDRQAFEYHLLAGAPDGLGYLTLRCRDIECHKNIETEDIIGA